MFDLVAATRRQRHVHGVAVAEEVVQIAQDFLVRAGQKHPEVVLVAGHQRVQLEHVLDVAPIDEVIDLPIGVTGDVGQHRPPRRLFGEAVDGHDGKQLVDGPDIGQRLEHGEIAEVSVRERAFKTFELLGHLAHVAHLLEDPLADGPEDVLGHHPLG